LGSSRQLGTTWKRIEPGLPPGFFPLGTCGRKWKGVEYTIKGKVVASPKSRPWWVLCVPSCLWLILTPKVLQLCINHFVLVLCKYV
jgi:hypothetical protein